MTRDPISRRWHMIRVALAALLLVLAAAAVAGDRPVVVLHLDGVISPATADFFRRGMERAREQDAALVVLELDTPGGLETSMREIIKDILNSPIPVATWVGPSGARAASAGTYILYASHVAAMAPASNLGAATPVAIGGGGSPAAPAPPADGARPSGKTEAERATSADAPHEKAVNDSAAYIRSLAQLRGRNAEFAEKAVREARSLSAQEALSSHVIDLIAPDIDELLKRIDGRKVSIGSSTAELHTAGAPLLRIEPGWRTKLLTVVSNPMVAVVLMMLGVYGLFIEIIHPGAAVPGVAGSICLLLALYAFHLLPVNWAGVGLVLLGAAMMIAELFLPTFGVIGVGGIIALIAGTLMLVDPELPGFGVPLAFVTVFAALSALAIFGAGGFALRARRRPVVSGREALLGADGIVTVSAMEETWARVQGESWRVQSPQALSPGQRVRVVAVDGLTLQVEPSEAGGPAADH